MKKNLKVYASMGLVILVVLFTLQNTERVSISFLFWEFQISRALMIFAIFIIGILTGFYIKRK
ncbi:MAG: DUF1049 domain-containing protein [Nitrospinaceae bacterium]|nr:LapA family protein [Nitrospinaceae bacterium]NIR55966.1 LapA family protein [Nitrospinaceae bacterium]NIT83247.1 LapA family protein [Nitrospinaceae bacterium]NIW07029.1 DUF1049 domain-containing protein [Nitrospinaceae bacterium]NIW60192.1 DUF1049 domain-containing protein [Nitrospinaceae bacterium]